MGRPRVPCKDCPFRTVGCHSKCELYLDYIKHREEYRKEKAAAQIVKEYVVSEKEKAVRSREKSKKRKTYYFSDS